MKFSLAALSALPMLAFAAPITGTVPISSLNPDLATELVGSLQAQVKPLIGSLQAQLSSIDSILAILPAGTKLDSLSLDDLTNVLHTTGLDVTGLEKTVEKDLSDITSAMTTVASSICDIEGVLPSTEEVSNMMHDLLTDITDVVSKLQSTLNNEEVLHQLTSMTGALSSVVTGLTSTVQNFLPTFQKEVSGLTTSLPSTMNGLLQTLHL